MIKKITSSRYGVFTYEDEVWRPIPEWGFRYLISITGNLYDFKLKDYVNPRKDRDGYSRYNLYNLYTQKTKHFYIHQLVLLAWKGSCPEGMECHHKDEDRNNNHIDNLEYRSHIRNMRERKNFNCAKRFLTDDEVKQIKRLYHFNGASYYSLAKQFDRSIVSIRKIINGDTYFHVNI